MKSKKLNSIISSLLAVIMLATLTGCTKENKDASKDQQGTKDKVTEEVLGYPITKDPITLRYWLTIHPQATAIIRSYAENECYMEMEKITGIKVDYIHPASGQENEQFNLMIASGDLPDMIQEAGKYKGGVPQGVEEGVYLDINEYLQKFAPDYYKLVNSDPEIKRQASSENGHIQAFYMIKPRQDVPWRRLITRKDWLNEAGMKEPKNLTEWEAYLKVLKDRQKGDSPYVMTPNGMEAILMGAYNLIPGFYLKDGKNVGFGQMEPKFKDYLTTMNRWFTYGYISKDFPSIKEPQSQTLYSGGKTGVIATSVDQTFTIARAAGFDNAPTPFPRVNDSDTLHWVNEGWPVQGYETVVTANSKYKTEAIRWLNYAYSEEGAMLYNFGVKGKTYNMENGKPKFTDYILHNPKYPTGTSYILRIHFGPKLCYPGLECNAAIIANGEESINNRLMWSDDKNIDNKYVLPPLRLTAEESSNRARIMTEVNTYVNEMVLKFITGKEPLSRYDEYVSFIKKLGMDEAIQITQKAYAGYMK